MVGISRFDLCVSSNTACHMLLGRHKNVENVLDAASRRTHYTSGLKYHGDRLDRFLTLPSRVKVGFKNEVIPNLKASE